MAALQGSLLDFADNVELGMLGVSVERRELASGAWVDIRRHWVRGTAELLDHLSNLVPWHSERRQMYERVVDVPRLLAFYDERDRLPHRSLDVMRDVLSEHYRNEAGGDLRTAGLCLYRDGNDSVAWHGDRVGRGDYEDVIVAVISLGASRPFLLRPRGGGRSIRLTLDSGDLLVMGGSCQRTFEHAVPKTARTIGTRISVQFRAAGAR